VRRHFGGDFPGNRALVKRRGAFASDQAQRRGQVLLHQQIACLHRRATLEENRLACGPGGEGLFPVRKRLGQRLAHGKAVFGQAGGWLDHPGQRQRAPVSQRVRKARDGAGHADGVGREERLAADDLAACVQVHVAVGAAGRHFAEIQRHVAAGPGVMHHHEAAAAQVACVGQRHRQRKAHGDGGIHRIAAVFEDVQADARGQRLFARDHAMACHQRVEHVHVIVIGGRSLPGGTGLLGRGNRRDGGRCAAAQQGQ